jgi:flagellar biosynthesis chaperone FliJ
MNELEYELARVMEERNDLEQELSYCERNLQDTEHQLAHMVDRYDELDQNMQYIKDFLTLKGITSKDIQEYIDSRQVADKLTNSSK